MTEIDKTQSISAESGGNSEHSGVLHPGGVLQSGQIIGGKYSVVGLLGKGGMGSVYLVRQLFLQKEFALKTLESNNSSEVAVRRFQLEAKAASSLNHPNLVQVHDFGLLDNAEPYLVMDFVEGLTLAALIKDKGQLEVENAVKIFSQVCLGLAFAHQQGVVHRDIKPSNIMLVKGATLGTEGSVKVVDFGIAKLTASDDGEIQALTKTGEIFGSPLYMSPEQCTGTNIDFRTDIYSLGCVLYEALTGAPPHMGETALTTMIQHQSSVPLTLRQATLGKDYPEKLEEIVAKMLAKNPNDRYQNLGTVALDLSNLFRTDSHTSIERASAKEKKISKTVTLKVRDLSVIVVSIAVLFSFIGAFLQLLMFGPKAENTPKAVIAPPPQVVSLPSADKAPASEKAATAELENQMDKAMSRGVVNHIESNINNEITFHMETATRAHKLNASGRSTEAIPVYEEALKNWKETKVDYIQKFHAYVGLGDALRGVGKFLLAKEPYAHAVDLITQYDPQNKGAMCLVLIRQGIVAVSEGKNSEAESIFKHSLVLNQALHGKHGVETIEELIWLANIYATPQVGRFSEAMDYYEQAIALTPKQGEGGKTNRAILTECEGVCLFNLKRYDEAMKKLLQAKKGLQTYCSAPQFKGPRDENAKYIEKCKQALKH